MRKPFLWLLFFYDMGTIGITRIFSIVGLDDRMPGTARQAFQRRGERVRGAAGNRGTGLRFLFELE
jgi:hypothetical protein